MDGDANDVCTFLPYEVRDREREREGEGEQTLVIVGLLLHRFVGACAAATHAMAPFFGTCARKSSVVLLGPLTSFSSMHGRHKVNSLYFYST